MERRVKKDTGLDSLEYGSESESEAENEGLNLIPDPIPIEEYQLPKLKSPSSYDECRRLNEKLAPKILAAVSSPTREEFKSDTLISDTPMFPTAPTLRFLATRRISITIK